jgi:hypothetical protein
MKKNYKEILIIKKYKKLSFQKLIKDPNKPLKELSESFNLIIKIRQFDKNKKKKKKY